jgi:hypothetical protein
LRTVSSRSAHPEPSHRPSPGSPLREVSAPLREVSGTLTTPP